MPALTGDEAGKAAEEEARKAAEEEARKAAEEEARNAAEEESRKAAEEESRKAAEEEARKADEGEARKAAEEEEEARKAAESRKAAEEESRKAEEASRAKAAAMLAEASRAKAAAMLAEASRAKAAADARAAEATRAKAAADARAAADADAEKARKAAEDAEAAEAAEAARAEAAEDAREAAAKAEETARAMAAAEAQEDARKAAAEATQVEVEREGRTADEEVDDGNKKTLIDINAAAVASAVAQKPKNRAETQKPRDNVSDTRRLIEELERLHGRRKVFNRIHASLLSPDRKAGPVSEDVARQNHEGLYRLTVETIKDLELRRPVLGPELAAALTRLDQGADGVSVEADGVSVEADGAPEVIQAEKEMIDGQNWDWFALGVLLLRNDVENTAEAEECFGKIRVLERVMIPDLEAALGRPRHKKHVYPTSYDEVLTLLDKALIDNLETGPRADIEYDAFIHGTPTLRTHYTYLGARIELKRYDAFANEFVQSSSVIDATTVDLRGSPCLLVITPRNPLYWIPECKSDGDITVNTIFSAFDLYQMHQSYVKYEHKKDTFKCPNRVLYDTNQLSVTKISIDAKCKTTFDAVRLKDILYEQKVLLASAVDDQDTAYAEQRRNYEAGQAVEAEELRLLRAEMDAIFRRPRRQPWDQRFNSTDSSQPPRRTRVRGGQPSSLRTTASSLALCALALLATACF